MRADRLVSILLLLQMHRRMTARELAQRLEVSERTIHRDMEALSASGVPVYAERGTGGGWRLPAEYHIRVPGLNEPEVQALFLAKPARILADLGLAGVAEAALVKLLSALPAASRRDAEYARQRLHIDTTGWNRAEESVPHLQTIQEAVWQDRKLQLKYRRSDGNVVDRSIDPLGLVNKGSVWYLVAAVDGELRSYRVSRVQEARLTTEPCERPVDFVLADYWEQSTNRFRENLPRYPVTLRVAPAVVPRLRLAGHYIRIERRYPADADGWSLVSITFQFEEDACEYILGFGPSVEVVEPTALNDKLLDLAKRTVEHYRRRATQQPMAAHDPAS